MFAAVCVIVGVFIWLLRENAELQRLKQSVTETVQTAESKQLQETLEKIQTQATEISDNLNDYSWIGSEEDGKISYLKQLDDGSWQVRKILIYPSLSKDNQYEEYYYWKNELFFAIYLVFYSHEKAIVYLILLLFGLYLGNKIAIRANQYIVDQANKNITP